MEFSINLPINSRVSQKAAKTIRKWRKRLYKAYKEGRIFGETKTKQKNGYSRFESSNDQTQHQSQNLRVNRHEPSWNRIYGMHQKEKIDRESGYDSEPRAGAVSTALRRQPDGKPQKQKVIYVPYIPAPNLEARPQFLFPTTAQPSILNQSDVQRMYFVTANPFQATTLGLLQEFAPGFENSRGENDRFFHSEKREIQPYPPEPFWKDKVDELTRESRFTSQQINPFLMQKSFPSTTAPQFLTPIPTLPPVNSFLIQKSRGSGGFGIPREREFVELEDEDLDDPKNFDFAPIREVRTSSGLMESDDKCNSLRLRTIIQNNIIANDAEASKRAIQQEAEKDMGRFIDVICGTGFFSYIAHTDEFCLATSGGVNCYAFSPVCGGDGPQMEFRKNRQKFLNKN